MLGSVKRPLALGAAGSLCAFCLLLLLPGMLWWLVAGAALGALVSVCLMKRQRRLAGVLLVACGLLLGCLWRAGYDRLVMDPARSLVGCREKVSAVVTDKRDYGLVIRAEAGGHRFRCFCKLYDTGDICPGDRLTFVGEFSLPTSTGGFDGERYYAAQGMAVTCTPEETPQVEKGKAVLYAAWYAVRHAAGQMITRLFGLYEGEMNALLLGNKAGLAKETRAALAATGLSHAFVVSGMHLSFVVSCAAFLRTRKGYLWVAGPLALGFALLSGMGLSVVRAFLMLLYKETADALCLPRDTATELSVSLALMLFCNPYALLNAGLVLSYLAVCGLLFLYPRLMAFFSPPLALSEGRLHAVLAAMLKATAVSLAAGIATLPALTFYMQRFSVVFLVTNPLLLWMVEAIFVLGAVTLLLGFVYMPLARLVALPVKWLLGLFLKTNAFFASLPFAGVGVESRVVAVAITLSVALLFLLVILKKPVWRPLPLGIMAVLLLGSVLWHQCDVRSRDFTLTVLPTRHACALLSVQGVQFLIGYDEEAEALLQRKNIGFVDYLVLAGDKENDAFEPPFPVGRVLREESAAFAVGETCVAVSPEGNLWVKTGETTLSVMPVPGVMYPSDAYVLSREAIKQADRYFEESGTVYGFGTPPRRVVEKLSIARYAYLEGELQMVAAGGKLRLP